MAKAIYITSFRLFVSMYVCLFVCLDVKLWFLVVFSWYFLHFKSNYNHISGMDYVCQKASINANFKVKGQRTRSQRPSRSNHANQFFSKSLNPIFTKFCVHITHFGAHNRLDFGKDPDTKTLAKSRICYIGWAFLEWPWPSHQRTISCNISFWSYQNSLLRSSVIF